LRNRTFFNRPDRLSVGPIENKRERLLGQLNNRLDRFSINSNVREDRGGGHVVVPDVVMSQLVVPDAFARLNVEAYDRRRKQVVPRALSAILVARRAFYGYVRVPKLFINCKRRPCAGVPCVDVRPIHPRVFAELALAWNGMKAP